MKVSLISSLYLFVLAIFPQAQPDYMATAQKILNKGLTENYTYTLLEKICSVGPRLSGSPQAAAAVVLTHKIMTELGLQNVHLEETEVPHWVRGDIAAGKLKSSTEGTLPLAIQAIGNSIATPPAGITAPVLEVHSFAELRVKRAQAAGKIIFFNRAMDPTLLNTFSAYGGAANQRTSGAVEAARAGGVAALVRSLTMRIDDYPHTGMLSYDRSVPRIPAACVSTIGADRLSEMLQKEPTLEVSLSFNCENKPPVTSHNVIGQLTGTEKPEEIILLGGHLDSWDLSVGAHDDGAGCAQSIAALRLLQKLGLKTKRTIRAVMFMNEEFGGTGGRAYAAAAQRKSEKHLAALESDRGGFLPLALGFGVKPDVFRRLKTWEPVFRSIGLQRIQLGGGGVDIAPLGQHGTILCSLIPDSQRYFDVHHSGKDTLRTVNPRELELGTIALAVFAYILAQEGI